MRLPYGFDPNEAKPNWEEGGKVHNWRNHVGPRAKGIWDLIPSFVRTAIAMDAQDEASSEEWE